jgi:hypothetical protein
MSLLLGEFGVISTLFALAHVVSFRSPYIVIKEGLCIGGDINRLMISLSIRLSL